MKRHSIFFCWGVEWEWRPDTHTTRINLTLIDTRLYQKTIFKTVGKWKNISMEQNGVQMYIHTCVCVSVHTHKLNNWQHKLSKTKGKRRII